MVLSYIDKHGSIKRAVVVELYHLSLPQAYHLLKRMEKLEKIQQSGKMRHASYTRKI
jgi:ATP-dependent DNA helicase RecG